MTASISPGHYSRTLDGHRAAYLNFVIARFGGSRVSARHLFSWKGPVLFLMVEENFALYFLTAIWRSLIGRRTVGLLFRPGPAVEARNWRLRFKRALLQGLRALPQVRTLSIVPVPLNPRIGGIVDGWIHDFQLWDLTTAEHATYTKLRHSEITSGADSSTATALLIEARRFAGGRPILVALGMQNRDKGVERLAASMREGGTAGWAVLVAGRFAPEAEAARATIDACGGHVIDRFLSDEEMLALYAAADAVWCLYDPAYDQGSGILGRAVQLGVPPIVRCGSFSEAFCRSEGIFHAAAEGGEDIAHALYKITKDTHQRLEKDYQPERIAIESVRRLRHDLGLRSEHAS